MSDEADIVFTLVDVACVCRRKHTMLTPTCSKRAWEEVCLLVCPDRDDGFEPCDLCSLYWRERLRAMGES